ncbi:acyl carrier protein [Dokdonia sinensis]|uniref:Acyl carrier protein n=1 Tax=Dokdonia sinensis TaxID=2479847 RepID=A0A3M0G9C0_9FLAO|nr:phosphopantetheine-binding protein [Dokdonia sinensis]RMB61018.1 acyl carrier protein [Dokdonia sinensis]
MNSHYEELKNIIKIYLPEDVSVDEITPNSHLINELNINSANLVDVVLDVEDHFDITIEDDEIEKMDTVASALEVIDSKINTK